MTLGGGVFYLLSYLSRFSVLLWCSSWQLVPLSPTSDHLCRWRGNKTLHRMMKLINGRVPPVSKKPPGKTQGLLVVLQCCSWVLWGEALPAVLQGQELPCAHPAAKGGSGFPWRMSSFWLFPWLVPPLHMEQLRSDLGTLQIPSTSMIP